MPQPNPPCICRLLIPVASYLHWCCRVKLPKTFLAVNLSDAFTFEELERQGSDNDVLEMKAAPPKDLLLADGGKPANEDGRNDLATGAGEVIIS